MEEEIGVDHLFFPWMFYYYVEKNQDPAYMKGKNESTYSTVVWWVLGSHLYFRNAFVFYSDQIKSRKNRGRELKPPSYLIWNIQLNCYRTRILPTGFLSDILSLYPFCIETQSEENAAPLWLLYSTLNGPLLTDYNYPKEI